MAILDLFKLDGKVAIVTGGARGLGQGLALAMAEAGADVVTVDVLEQNETKAKVEALGRKCETVIADLSKTGDIPKIIDAGVGAFGHIDILFNNAGSFGGRIWSISRRRTGMTSSISTSGRCFSCRRRWRSR